MTINRMGRELAARMRARRYYKQACDSLRRTNICRLVGPALQTDSSA